MKKTITSLSLFAAIALSAVVAQAAAPTILVVDMAKLYDSHYKTDEQNAKLRADEQKAQEEIEKMNKDGNVLVDEYKGLSEQANNPSLTDAACIVSLTAGDDVSLAGKKYFSAMLVMKNSATNVSKNSSELRLDF